MPWKQVTSYNLGYSISKRAFFFYYTLQDENVTYQVFPTAEEFMALADMFRNEGPIAFNTEGKYFVTAMEGIGEEETLP